MTTEQYVLAAIFEHDYLVRTLGDVAHKNDVALTELVANAWDAGASLVRITIPEAREQALVVEDDGVGLTPEQFHDRWMRLGYDRLAQQGSRVAFPPGRAGNRTAYGRNGIGRHGLLCFNNEYTVVTTSSGRRSQFVVTTQSADQPFVLKSEHIEPGEGNGTRLEVIVQKNLPDPTRILELISARFLHDPQFRIEINGETVPLESHVGLVDSRVIEIDGITLHLHFLDTQVAARTTLYQGIAFWQAGRLVGEPSWSLGKDALIDGRTRFAKRYTGVVKTNDLAPFVNEEWTGFKTDPVIDKVYAAVAVYVQEQFAKVASEHIDETKRLVKEDFRARVEALSPLGRYEVDQAIETIAVSYPTARPETLAIAVDAVIKLESSRSGRELLQKFATMSESDIEGLNLLLTQWTVRDALCVLDEIDKRLSVIEALRKLSTDSHTDELAVLHPLLTAARWVFGPEYESAEFTSNRQLQSVVKTLFRRQLPTAEFLNSKKRPDIVILPDATVSLTGTEGFHPETGLAVVTKVLIIELKKGKSTIGRDERNQATGYVEDLLGCGAAIGNPYVIAFVVGHSVTDKLQPLSTVKGADDIERGQVRIATYSQLIDTAERRLFGLRSKLNERYEGVPGMELASRAKQQDLAI